jgi:hypothetical protein
VHYVRKARRLPSRQDTPSLNVHKAIDDADQATLILFTSVNEVSVKAFDD